MKILKSVRLLLGAMLIPIGTASLSAQTNMAASSDSFFYQGNPLEITAEVGTTGYGGSVNWRITDHFGVRAGIDYLSYSLTRTEQKVSYHGTLRLQSEPTALDIYFSKNSSFHLTVGALWNQQQVTASAVPSAGSTVTINNNTYSLTGASLDAKVSQPSVMPYIGIGGDFFYFDKGHHVSMGGELGVAYGRWTTTLTTHNVPDPKSTLNRDRQTEQDKVNNTLNKVPIWPVLKLGINVSF